MKKNNFNQLVGENIKNFPRQMGLTQEELANAVELSRVSIVNIERGIQSTTLDKLADICSVLQRTPNDLFPPIPKSKAQRAPVTISFKTPKDRKECLGNPEFVCAMNKMITKAFYMKPKRKK